jgi:hypothetical protein
MNGLNDPGSNLGPKFLAIAVFAVALMWAQGAGYAGVFLEDGRNLVVAKALAGGVGLRYAHLPGAPPALDLEPLYPIALSVLWRAWPAFPENLTLIGIFDAAILGAAAWVVAIQTRRLPLPSFAVHATLVLVFVSVPVLALAANRFAEPLSLLLFGGAVWAADRRPGSLKWAVAAGLLAGLAGLTTRAALVVPVGICIGLLLQRRAWSALVSLVAGLAVLAPWGWWLIRESAVSAPWVSESHAALAAMTWLNVAQWVVDIPVIAPFAGWILPRLPWWVSFPAATLLFAAVVAGGAALFRLVPSLVVSVMLFALAAAFLPDAGAPSIWVVLPWLALFAAAGAIRAWAATRRTRAVVVALVGLIVIGYLPKAVVGIIGRAFESERVARTASVETVVASVRNEIPDEGIVGTPAAELVYLYTGRTAVPPPPVEPNDPTARSQLERSWCGRGVTHVAAVGRGYGGGGSTGRFVPLDSVLYAVFELNDGQALYALTCRD